MYLPRSADEQDIHNEARRPHYGYLAVANKILWIRTLTHRLSAILRPSSLSLIYEAEDPKPFME